jgi:uncharacterized damage-inducible protein DinB
MRGEFRACVSQIAGRRAPRLSVIRTMVLNHTIHHRGQLSVYLRLNDIPLPDIYGPTADSARSPALASGCP